MRQQRGSHRPIHPLLTTPPRPLLPAQRYEKNFAGLRATHPPWALAGHVEGAIGLRAALPDLKLAEMIASDPRLLLVSGGRVNPGRALR